MGDSYEGSLKNNYLYQGAYSELDDDIGWNDFALRNYDLQIGRWVQQDPYQEYASPYIGMGTDPVNLVDLSGGFVLAGLTKAGTAAILTLGGAIVGTAVGLISGDDDFTGTLIGAGIGLAAGLANLSLRIAINMGIQSVNAAVSIINTSTASTQAGSATQTGKGNSNLNIGVDKDHNQNQYDFLDQGQTIDVIDKRTKKVIGTILIASYVEEEDFKAKGPRKNDGSYDEYLYSGVRIFLLFEKKKGGSGYVDDFQWIQSITTNQGLGCGEGPFNDPCSENDNKPFYRDNTEKSNGSNVYEDREKDHVYKCWDGAFYDKPGRVKDSHKKVFWKAELTFVGRRKNGKNVALITIVWGFTLELINGKWVITKIEIIEVKPSTFQKNLIKQAQKK